MPQIQTQEEWRELLSDAESPVRYSTYDDTVLAFHRQVFAQAFPDLTMRSLYPIEIAPNFTGLVCENPKKTYEQMIATLDRNDALVIGASGANFLLALLAEYKQIDVIDLSESQIGWCYAVMVFIILTKPEDLEQRLEEFRQSQYFVDDFFSIQLPEVRVEYLRQIPDAIDWLKVPDRFHNMIYRALELESIMVLRKLIDSIEDFLPNYAKIRQRLLTGQLPNLLVGDIFEHLEKHLEFYDAIVSSNVFEWSARAMSLREFCTRMLAGLKPGGVANAHNINGLDIQELGGDFSVLSFEPNKPNEWVNNWLLIQKN
ncbi:class I SAM-dependent methyltransferase [Candidatus Woesebacteria bacterium]|nr:class I SAM-dependent methyltransferase [Candidatus Woesebacteria bacterium]